ncbi:MAG: cytochrome [Bacteroidota bacterium]|nr:cytochrome [Bacteroidota bacterium]
MVKWIKRIAVILVVVIAAVLAYVKLMLPNVGKPEGIQISATPEMVKRGEYLANHVCVCIDCHSKRDWSTFSGPIVPGTEGKGGETFTPEFGFPGTFYSQNLTPANLKTWTDGEILRAITCGVDKNGVALFPVMPYHYYSHMDKEDIKSIIAYIRTLKPIPNKIPLAEPEFPMSFLINTIPEKACFTTMPAKENVMDYGAYLVNAAACNECHTNVIKGKHVEGMDFAGGREFIFPGGKKIVSANITPDKETGIGYWTEEAFVNKFKSFEDKSKLQPYKSSKDFQTIMPWNMYGGMDSTDLKAIYAYLRTLKPINNKIVTNTIVE